MNLKNGKVFTSKFVGTGPSSYKRRIYRAAVSQRLRNTGIEDREGKWIFKLVWYKNVKHNSKDLYHVIGYEANVVVNF